MVLIDFIGYSLFITIAGLILAAFRVCPIKVAKEMPVVIKAAMANNHHEAAS